MTRVAWFHCFSGIAGDMALGALVDAGADLDEVRAVLERLPMSGWAVEAEPVLRCGIAATHVRVLADEAGVVRTAAHIIGLVEDADLPPRVAERALATFHALAEAEGALHRRPPEQVHFHEVGGIDAIVDVVGTCAALDLLGVDEVVSSPVATGTGMVRAAHGLLPNPPPAVVRLLQGAPVYGVDLPYELTTPTGAALLAANAVGWGPLPAMRVSATGFGAGSREIDGQPNVAQVVLGEAAPRPLARAGSGTAGALGDAARAVALDGPWDGPGAGPLADPAGGGQPVVALEANVDDATGEVLAHTVAALLAAGAHDAWVTPIVMKKGRPAHTVSALADPALATQVAGVLAAETGSLGVRGATLRRWPASRTMAAVEVDGRPVRVKVGPGRVKAEHDDAAAVARATGRPLREVLAEAEASARAGTVTPVSPDTGAVEGDPDATADDTVVPLVPDDPDGHAHGHAHPHPHEDPDPG
jgi:uncharacterized protein (TIGR00299 family) protein